MDGGSIVLNSISCKGLKCFTLFQKPSVYAVLSITGGGDRRHPKREKHKTPADNEGGENPEWVHKIQLYLDYSDLKDLFLEFRIKAQGNLLLGDKLVGKSRVLIADLTEGQPSGVVRHVSYQVQSSDGKPNGVFSFSYKMNLPDFENRPPPPIDPVIPSARLQDCYPPPSSPNSFISLPASTPRVSLYPSLSLLDAAPRDIGNHNQPPPPVLANYYAPPPPPWPETLGYYRPSDSAVCLEPGCLPGHESANREYYLPLPAALPPPPPSPTQRRRLDYATHRRLRIILIRLLKIRVLTAILILKNQSMKRSSHQELVLAGKHSEGLGVCSTHPPAHRVGSNKWAKFGRNEGPTITWACMKS